MRDSQTPARIRVEVLGPLRLFVDGDEADVRGPKRRAVLALLALAEGRTVTVDHLVDALWPGQVPDSGRQALHPHMSRLRGDLGAAADRLTTFPDGYRLDLGPDGLDVTEARRLLQARSDLPALRAARQLWRGPVLADLTDIAPVVAFAVAAAQLHRDITDAYLGAAVDAGAAAEVVGLAAEASAADPLRESAVLALMRVLAATGEAPEALRHAREFRQRLAEETGLDPSPALATLERSVANGTAGPAAAAAVAAAPPPARAVRPPARMVGRDAQVAALHRLLADERLVTVVGPGGVGKTRIALELAHTTETATVLLLAPVTDPAAVPHALAAALDLTAARGDVLAACVALLGDRPGVLVIDNCEHLLDAARDTVDRVLSACPRLTVLATSREPLGLPAEYAFRLSPLTLPGAASGGERPAQQAGLLDNPAIAVFLDRAARVRPGPPPTGAELHTVADIVRRLDGMPLAIELAAGRLSTFSLTDLHRRLDRSLDLLGGGRTGGDQRHRTLRATVAWSYDLLNSAERKVFRHLAVFPDGVDLSTAEQLAASLADAADPGSIVARLVDASMVEADFTGATTRYRMLETLRAYGLDRLAAEGEDEAAADRLTAWAVELTGWIGAAMTTVDEPAADAALRRELPNLRAAWRHLRQRGDLDAAAAVITAFMDAVGYRDLVELRGWAEELAADPALIGHPGEARVLGVAAEAVYHRGDYQRAEELARAGLAVAAPADRRFCLLPLAVAALARGRFAEVIEHALEGAAVDPADLRETVGLAALATAYAGDPDRARTLNDRGAGAAAPSMRAWTSYVAGEIENIAGRGADAERHYTEAIDLARTSGATFLTGVATVGLLTVRTAAGRTREALEGYGEVVEYFARTGNWTHLWATLRNLAELLHRLGDHEPATVLLSAADAAPDAPAAPGAATAAGAPFPGRAVVLATARAAITRHLAST